MTNITKEVFDNLEQEIDVFAKNKTLGSSEAKPYLDEYHSKIIDIAKVVVPIFKIMIIFLIVILDAVLN